MIALAGGLLGLLVSVWTTSALLRILPADATGGWIAATVNVRLLLFTLALSTFTGLLFGLAPALQASRAEVASTLREQRGGLASAGGAARFRRMLVVAQLALSLLLLVGAGLFARSLFNLLRVDPGFRTRTAADFRHRPALNGYSNERGFALFHDLQERIARLPGVAAVGAASPGPLDEQQSRQQRHGGRLPGARGRRHGCLAARGQRPVISARSGTPVGARPRGHRARPRLRRTKWWW